MSDPTELNQGGPPPPQVPGWKPPPDIIGTVLADRYKVISTLGDGGMGKVYLGEHVTLRKKVAIKVLKQEFCHDRTNVERFLQEARAASMIRHENIVDIMDFGQVPGGSVFFVMELLEGSDISDVLKKVKRMPWLRTRNILLQVVRALKAAHESGIIHRDMKPGNVYLIARASATDYVKVLDFGIAKVDDANTGLTRTGAVFGTAGYMAPEQACGDPVDGRTDVYAVGCMMYQMLTGQTPFPGTNFMRVLTQHMNEPPTPPRDVCADADVSDEVETIILTALAKKAEDRFPDMAAFERAIAQANGEVATVPPVNRPRTNKGTVVLEDQVSPFAGMTPGAPPPDLNLGDLGGADAPNTDATMMLDGMGGVALGGGGEGDGGNATMMLDGMGGVSLGGDGGGGGDATMMLDGMGGEAIKQLAAEAQAEAATADAGYVAPPAKSNKKLFMMLGGGLLAILLIVGLAMALSGGDDDELASNDDDAADSAKESGEPAADSDGAAEAGDSDSDTIPSDSDTIPSDSDTIPSDTGEPASDGDTSGMPVADTGSIPGDSGGVDSGTGDADTSDANTGGEVAGDSGLEEVPTVNPNPKNGNGGTATVKTALSDSDINRGLKRIKKKVSKCTSKGGLPGMKIEVNFMVADGKVKTASARPPHTSTAVGKCVANAVKGARFAKAKQSKIANHTFKL